MSNQTSDDVKDELIDGLISIASSNIFQWAELDHDAASKEMMELINKYTITKKVSKEVQ